MAQQSFVDIEDGEGFDDFYASSGQESSKPLPAATSQQSSNTGFFSREQMASMVWEAGKTQAGKAWSIWGNIDLLRPYFDVEPRDVLMRIIASFVPKPPTATPIKVHIDLYGPSMLVLTLIALLLYEMKLSNHTVQEGTLMGSAFATCFGYWLGIGVFIFMTAYVCNTHISLLQTLSMFGYSLTSQCIVVLLSCLVHTGHDEAFFYAIFLLFGGLSTLRMMSIAISRTHGPTQKIVLCTVMTFFSFTFMLYLHFAYHTMVEEISQIVKSVEGLEKDALTPVAMSVNQGH